MSNDAARANRVLVIGWDGATFELVRPFAAQGHLPNVARLMDEGAFGTLRSTVPPLSAPAWVSIMTGKNPGKHGCLLFATEREQPPYGLALTDATTVDAATLWTLLSRAGKRVISVNVPMTYPPQQVNGILISGFTTPSQAVTFTYPPDLASSPLMKDYLIEVGYEASDGQSIVDAVGQSAADQVSADPAQFLRDNTDLVRRRTRVCAALMAQERWDLFFVVFTSLDRVSHFFWRELAALAAGESAGMVRCGRELIEYLHALDGSLGELMAAAGDGTYTLVISDHGFGPASIRVFFLNSWLAREGLLASEQAAGRQKRVDLNRWMYFVRRSRSLTLALIRFLPHAWKQSLRRRIEAQRSLALDYARSRAYAVPMAAFVAGIKIPDYIGAEERRQLADRIERSLSALRDPATDVPLVSAVRRREDLYHGPHVAEFPDLILFLHPDYTISRAVVAQEIISPSLAAVRTGDHALHGIVMLHGPDVVPGELVQDWQVVDVPVTIAYLAGIDIPDDMDGHVIEEAFDAGWLAAHPPAYAAAEAVAPTFTGGGLAAGDEDVVVSRLRGLGYVD